MKRVFVIAAALAACAFPAWAQTQASYENVTRAPAEMMDGLIVSVCADNDRTVTWLSLDELGYPLRGDRSVRDSGTRIFTERYEATGCGAPPRRLNVQVFHGGARPTPAPMLLPPGQTAISAGIMVDLFRTHVPQLMALRHPTCRSAPPGQPIFLVTDTTALNGEPFALNQTWTERWAYRACGVADSVDISFTTDGERVTMSMAVVPATP